MKNGFTLLELSMVLVIIGLISGGIFLGRELILIAQIRRQVTQIEQINTAVYTFQGKYNCLPGDCVNAVDFGLGVAGGQGDYGNGDGKILPIPDPPPATTVTDGEERDFWYHLGQADLLERYPYALLTPTRQMFVPGVNSPLAQLPGNGLFGGKAGLRVHHSIIVKYGLVVPVDVEISPAYVLSPYPGFDTVAGPYLPQLAGLLDRKIDDGLPMSGNMIAHEFWLAGTLSGRYVYPSFFLDLVDAVIQDNRSCIDIGLSPPQYSTKPEAQSPNQFSMCLPIIKAQF